MTGSSVRQLIASRNTLTQFRNLCFKLGTPIDIKLCTVLSMALLCASVTSVFSQKPKPNVLFIVCDDLNTHVSSSGYPHITTPAFDHLAAEGMTFRRAYCQYPVCGPSRTSFLSGLYPQSTGILSNKTDIREIRPGTVSLPQRFKECGYWTGAVGKVFHTTQEPIPVRLPGIRCSDLKMMRCR